jgi:glycosyltransferase involved in cell wall biosynthesis
MVTLEAMAMAKPIVATNIDGITEQIVDQKDGILVPPKNSKLLGKAIINFLSDKQLAKKMSQAGREKVEKVYPVERMISETEKLYISLMESK